MSKLIKINYDALQAGDMVHCAGRSPFAMITRIVTSGWKNKLNHNISVHTGIIINIHGQKFISEMQASGLEFNDLERYNKEGGRRWIIDVTRNDLLNSSYNQIKIQQQMALDRRRTIEYDFKGLVEFVIKKVKDDKSKNYCSEYVYYLTRKTIDCEYPDKYKIKVSPRDLQLNSPGWESIPNWRI